MLQNNIVLSKKVNPSSSDACYMKWLRRAAFVFVGAGALKAAHVTLAEEWEEVGYLFRKHIFGRRNTAITRIPSNDITAERRKQRVVVLGTGWGALSFIRHLDPENIDVIVVSPRSFFFYTPLLAGISPNVLI